MPWLQLAHSDVEVRQWFAAGHHQRRHEVWVAGGAGAVSAFMALSRDRCWVDHLYVDPRSQGRGLGSQLLALAKSRSRGQLRLWAFGRNIPARDFYERRGFRAVEFSDGSQNEEGEPDVLYLWELDT
ncbi:MAG: GNAT family N-acetyltransferase [Candidatus Dormibacteria bacterium]